MLCRCTGHSAPSHQLKQANSTPSFRTNLKPEIGSRLFVYVIMLWVGTTRSKTNAITKMSAFYTKRFCFYRSFFLSVGRTLSRYARVAFISIAIEIIFVLISIVHRTHMCSNVHACCRRTVITLRTIKYNIICIMHGLPVKNRFLRVVCNYSRMVDNGFPTVIAAIQLTY